MATHLSHVQRSALVTGGTGFIGRHIVSGLTDAGWRVRLLVRDLEKVRPLLAGRESLIEVIPCDLQGNIPSGAFIGVDAVIHCAGLVLAPSAKAFEKANVDVTKKIASLTKIHAPKSTFVHLSSLAAREPHLSAYALSKRQGEERLATLFDQSTPWTALRLPVVYGPSDRQSFKLFHILSKGLLLVPTTKNQRFSAIHVNDVASLVHHLITHCPQGNGLIEIDDGQTSGYSWQYVCEVCEEILGRRIRILRMPKSAMLATAGFVEFSAMIRNRSAFLSRGKIHEMYHPNWVSQSDPDRSLNGWIPKIPLKEGFRQTFEWYKVNNWI